MIVRPLARTSLAAPAESIAQSFTSRGEDHLYVHLDGNAQGLDIDDLADKLAVRMERTAYNRSFSIN